MMNDYYRSAKFPGGVPDHVVTAYNEERLRDVVGRYEEVLAQMKDAAKHATADGRLRFYDPMSVYETLDALIFDEPMAHDDNYYQARAAVLAARIRGGEPFELQQMSLKRTPKRSGR